MKKRFILIIIEAVVFLLSDSVSFADMTLKDLRTHIKENKMKSLTGKITFIKNNPNYSADSKVIVRGQEIDLKRKGRFSKNVIYFDNNINVVRTEEDDLNRENLSEEERFSEDITNIQILQGSSRANFFPSAKAVAMDNRQGNSDNGYNLNDYKYGYVKDSWLTIGNVQESSISEIIEDGRDIIVVESSAQAGEKNRKRIVKILPEFGYRLLEVNEFEGENLKWEVKYANYKKYDKYYLPETYTNKRYLDGEIVREIEIMIEEAVFDIDFDKDIASIEVPEGTQIFGISANPEIPLKTWHTTKRDVLTIEDIYAHEIDEIASEEIRNMSKMTDQSCSVGDDEAELPFQVFFIPNVEKTLSENKISVFNFDKNKVITTDSIGNLEKVLKEMSEKKQGDLLWNNDLIFLGEIKLSNDSLKPKQKDEIKSVYEIIKQNSLPIQIAFSKNNKDYFLNIQKITKDGIYIYTNRK